MMYFDLRPDSKQVIEASPKHSGSALFCSTAQAGSAGLAFPQPSPANREHKVTLRGWGVQKGGTPASRLLAQAHSSPKFCKCHIFSHFS